MALRTILADIGAKWDNSVLVKANAQIEAMKKALEGLAKRSEESFMRAGNASQKLRDRLKLGTGPKEEGLPKKETGIERARLITMKSNLARQAKLKEDAAKKSAANLAKFEKVKFSTQEGGPQRAGMLGGIFGRNKDNAKGGKEAAGAIGGVVKGVAAFFALKAGAGFVKEEIEKAAALNDLSKKSGIATKDLQALGYVAKQSGSSAESITSGFKSLNMQLGSGKPSEASQQLAKFGIQTKDAAGKSRPLRDLLPEIADKIEGLGDQAKQTGAATNIFGKAGTELLPILKGGGKEAKALLAEFEGLGGGMSDDFIKAAAATNDRLGKLDTRMENLKSRIVQAALPALEKMVITFDRVVSLLQKYSKESKLAEASLIAFGAAAAVASIEFLPLLAGIALAAGAFALLALAIDDVMVWSDGGDSIIGGLLPKETQAKLLEFKNLAISTFETVKGAVLGLFTPERIQLFVTALSSVGSAIGSIFTMALNVIKFLAPVLVPIFGFLVDQALMIVAVIGQIVSVLADLVSWITTKGKPITDFLGGVVGGVSKFVGGAFNSGAAFAGESAVGASTAVQAMTAGGDKSQTVSIGPTTINVEGSGDPNAVAKAIVTTQERERQIAMGQLVPRFGGLE